MLKILFRSLNETKNCKIPLGLIPKPQLLLEKSKLVYQGLILLFFKKNKIKKIEIAFSHSFINSDCFNLGVDPGDAFLIFDVHKYVPVVTLVQCFITNNIVLVGNSPPPSPLYKEGALI